MFDGAPRWTDHARNFTKKLRGYQVDINPPEFISLVLGAPPDWETTWSQEISLIRKDPEFADLVGLCQRFDKVDYDGTNEDDRCAFNYLLNTMFGRVRQLDHRKGKVDPQAVRGILHGLKRGRGRDNVETPKTKRRRTTSTPTSPDAPNRQSTSLHLPSAHSSVPLDPIFRSVWDGIERAVDPLRSHHTWICVFPCFLRLIYQDHSVQLTSRSFSLNFGRTDGSDLDVFIAALIAFHRRPPTLNGLLSLIDHKQCKQVLAGQFSVMQDDHSDAVEGLRLHLTKGGKPLIVTLGKSIYRDTQPVGRSTCVVHATSSEWPNRPIAVKIQFTPKNAPHTENAFIDTARRKAKETGSTWVLDHLPNILHVQEVGRNDETERRVAEYIEAWAENGFAHPKSQAVQPMVMKVLIEEVLFPIETVPSLRQLGQVFVDIFECHRWLYKEAGILHRDISPENIMYRINADGEVCGVMNDFDVACFLRDMDDGIIVPSYLAFAGAPLYVALERTEPRDEDCHLYRHDLESLLFVMHLFMAEHRFMADGECDMLILGLPQRFVPVDVTPFWEWHRTEDDEELKGMYHKSRASSIHDFSDTFRLDPGYAEWVDGWRRLFSDGIEERRKWHRWLEIKERMQTIREECLALEGWPRRVYPRTLEEVDGILAAVNREEMDFDEETLNGHITFDRFLWVIQNLDGDLKELKTRM